MSLSLEREDERVTHVSMMDHFSEELLCSLSDFNLWMTQAVAHKKLAMVDKQLTRFFLAQLKNTHLTEKEQVLVGLFCCFLSFKMARGNVCVLLSPEFNTLLQGSFYLDLPHTIRQEVDSTSIATLLTYLEKTPLALIVEDDLTAITVLDTLDEQPPIFVIDQRVYFQRMWQDEQVIARFLVKHAKNPVQISSCELKSVLHEGLFRTSEESVDRQRIASVVALSRRVSVISGGPGTGKTTTVATILLAALRLEPLKKLRILLAAPTGKAAARLTESLLNAKNALKMTPAEQNALALEALTLHRLLGASHLGDGFLYNKHNPLHGDILIVDEASMIDLKLMAHLIDALPSSMRLILLGDRDQLSSVAPGRVLGDICHFGQLTFSSQMAELISEVLGIPQEKLLSQTQEPLSPVSDMIGLLTLSRRFKDDSDIGHMAKSINTQSLSAIKSLLIKSTADFDSNSQQFGRVNETLRFIPMPEQGGESLVDYYEGLLNDCVTGFSGYLMDIHDKYSTILEPESLDDEWVKDLLKKFNTFRVLASIHHGLFGTQGLNESIRHKLYQANYITSATEKHFTGRPILITQNDKSLGLFNGDIGMTLKDPMTNQLRVYFETPQRKLLSIAPSRLPSHETAFAMTVHKSQGSEFEHTLFVLPTEMNPVLTKELIYTAVTRAKDNLTIYSGMGLFCQAVSQITPRSSGLVEQIHALSFKEIV